MRLQKVLFTGNFELLSVVSPKGITPNPDLFDFLRDHQY
jgi:hypothetical protein